MENTNTAQNAENTKVHFTLAEVLAAPKEDSEIIRELREKLAGVDREYDYDVQNDGEDYFDDEIAYLTKEYGISEAAGVTLEMNIFFFSVKKTGDDLMNEMAKLTMGLEKFKNAVASGMNVEKVIAEVTEECGLENF